MIHCQVLVYILLRVYRIRERSLLYTAYCKAMPTNAQYLFRLVVLISALCLSGCEVYAFGAGNIPSFSYMKGRAFKHGDIVRNLFVYSIL